MHSPIRGWIQDIFVNFQTSDGNATPLDFVFWGNAARTTIQGEETMSGADIVTVGDGASTNIAHLGGLSIFYTDRDNKGRFYVSVSNHGAATLTGGVATAAFNFVPEYPA
jgi:hypothetical protein